MNNTVETSTSTTTTAQIINFNEAKAKRLFRQAYELQTNGFIDAAINTYSKSLEWYPMAQTFTFMAWAYASKRQYELAIELCRSAIQIDPEYGNSYNDIGAYLIELGRIDEAVEYLEKAIAAKDYDCRFYPYYNLGKVYMAKHLVKKAVDCFEKAVELKPEFVAAKTELEKLSGSLH